LTNKNVTEKKMFKYRVLYEYPPVFDLIAPCFLPATRISGEFSPLYHTTALKSYN